MRDVRKRLIGVMAFPLVIFDEKQISIAEKLHKLGVIYVRTFNGGMQ